MRCWPSLAFLLLTIPAAAQTIPTVDHAWARATSPLAETGAAYMVVHGGSGDEITGFSTPAAASASLHQTQQTDGVMKMRGMAALPVPPGQDVTLKPGGTHVMLMGLRQPLRPGDHFPLTVTFAHAAPVTVQVTVEAAGASAPTAGMVMPAHTHP